MVTIVTPRYLLKMKELNKTNDNLNCFLVILKGMVDHYKLSKYVVLDIITFKKRWKTYTNISDQEKQVFQINVHGMLLSSIESL